MSRHTPETLLISAVINSRNAHQHAKYGVAEVHFDGFRPEFEWIESFAATHGRTPTWDEMEVKWPDFPISKDQDDSKWPAAELLREYSKKRASKALLAAGLALRAGRVEEVVDIVRGIEIHQPVTKPPSLLKDYSYLDRWEDEASPRVAIPWEIPQSYTMGIGKGELWYLAARPSQGKTFITLNIAAHAALQGFNVALYSLEMTKEQTQQRMHTILANALGMRLNLNEIRRRQIGLGEYKEILQVIEDKVPGEIHVHTPADGPVTPSVIGAGAADYDLNLVDYIGLMKQDGGGRAVDDWRTIAAISNQLKEIALAHNTRIVAASQVNREAGNRLSPPKLSQLSQSDALAQDGDVVITFTRPSKHTMRYSMEKNRHGEADTSFWSEYDAAYGNFKQITRQAAEQIRYEDEEKGDI